MFHPRRTLRALLPPLAAGLALTALPAQTATAASTLTAALGFMAPADRYDQGAPEARRAADLLDSALPLTAAVPVHPAASWL